MEKIELGFTLNGKPVSCLVPCDARLLDVLRYDCGCTGTKEGCGEGECGACTVLLDDLPVNACLVPAFQIQGRVVETAESVRPELAHPMNRSGATQCGACTPGVAMSALWLQRHPEIVARTDPRELMSGHICRCTGYDGIMAGVSHVLRSAKESGEPAGESKCE
jgi:carbon-monoxide dehydrogenase small subunit